MHRRDSRDAGAVKKVRVGHPSLREVGQRIRRISILRPRTSALAKTDPGLIDNVKLDKLGPRPRRVKKDDAIELQNDP